MIFGPDGKLLCNHRKLKPTGAERIVWGDADRDYFPTVDSPWGTMGALICWENYMPLARVALYQKGVSLYLCPNTNNNPEWHDTIKHIAIEGKCFVFHVNQYFTRDMYPTSYHGPAADEIARLPKAPCNGGSAIIAPYGHRCGTARPSSTPTSIPTRPSEPAWSSTPAAITPVPM